MPPSRILTRSAHSLSQPRPSISTSRPFTPQNPQTRPASSTTSQSQTDIHALLSHPTWSVRALLPSSTTPPQPTIPASTLHHLLRLSSLPAPATPLHESALLSTLHTQLHFVRAIKAVDTHGIAPLTAIRDESATTAAATVTLDMLRETFAGEKTVGFRGRPRRLRDGVRERSTEEVLVEERTRARRDGAYYVVESGKAKRGE